MSTTNMLTEYGLHRDGSGTLQNLQQFLNAGFSEGVTIFNTVQDIIDAGGALLGTLVQTKGYYTEGDGGGALYLISSIDSPDGYINHQVSPTLQATLQNTGNTLIAEQFGVVANDIDSASQNSVIMDSVKDTYPQGVVLHFKDIQYFFDSQLVIDDGMSITGMEGVTYRDNHEGQTRFTFTNDTDGITINGFSSFRNAIKNIKIDNNLAVGTSTSVGMNFSANGGGVGTRALSNIIENVTIQNFQSGIIIGSAGDFNWNQEFKNLKIFRCQVAVTIDGSNGVGQIDGLHVDGNGGFTSGRVGLRVNNANGYTIRNYGLEHNERGMEWLGDDNNDRMYMYDGYFESNSTADILIGTNTFGQCYFTNARFAYFSASAKNQCVLANSGASVQFTFKDLSVRGDQSGSDGLLRVFDINSAPTRIHVDGLNLQAACDIWTDFGGKVSPVYVKMLNQDKQSNFFELWRDTVTPERMFAKTDRVTSVTPTNDTFIIARVDGSDLDLKYIGATVRGLTAGAWNEWIWDGTAFVTTP